MRAFAVLSLCLLLSGCASTSSFPDDSTARAATDVPDAFTPAGSASHCVSPLTDPRDGTELRLDRSMSGRGDYVVPAGKYGAGADELLRIDCATGRAVGIVRR